MIMNNPIQFLVPVSESGLPHNRCLVPRQGTQNLKKVSAKKLTRMYWTLKEIIVEYQFQIDGERVSRKLNLHSETIPPLRMKTCPVFQSKKQDAKKRAYSSTLDFFNVARTKKDHYALSFTLQDKGSYPSYLLTTHPPPSLNPSSSKPFACFDQSCFVSLYLFNPSSIGHIQQISIKTLWY